MRRYYITNRKAVGGVAAVLRCMERNIRDGVDMIQIREYDLPAAELIDLTRRAVALVAGTSTRILVNSRADIAVITGAHGVHLPANSIPPARLRPIRPSGFVIGVSCHTRMELQRAQTEDADFAVFGPVFPSPGKGAAVGIDGLRAAVRGLRLPVYALGGITKQNAADCLAAGATGVAAITWFQSDG